MFDHKAILEMKSDDQDDYIPDPRTDDIMPYVRSLHFLKNEAKKNGYHDLHELIDSTFKMVLYAHDIIEKRNIIKDPNKGENT